MRSSSRQSTLPDRTLIFGGTFDPPHVAHVELPRLAARELGCDRIIYVPAAVNPLKSNRPPTDAAHRLAMLKLALRDVPEAEISTIELEREGPSYTIDTLRALTTDEAANAGDQPRVRLLIGADQALAFHQWKDWREILRLAQPAVMLRPPWDEPGFAQALRQRYDAAEAERWLRWTLTSLPPMDITATEIRRRISAGESLRGMLDPQVEAYIAARGLCRRDE